MSHWFVPIAVYYTTDGGEWLVRDYAGQSGRFCVIGPYTVDILVSCKSLREAKRFVEERADEGAWEKSEATGRVG